MEMLANWSKVKTIEELINEAFWLRTALIRYLARENKRPEFKEPLSRAIELLLDLHVASVAVKGGDEVEVEAKNQQGEKILRTIKTNLAYVGVDTERLIEDCKRDNSPKPEVDKDPWQ